MWCGKKFKSTTHIQHIKCCSTECARKESRSHVDNNKISAALAKYFGTRKTKNKNKTCPTCAEIYTGKTKYCSKKCVASERRKHLPEYEKYKRQCKFEFSLKDYPREFDFSMIEQHGWYKAKNRGNNLNGVSRDHIISIKWGFENGVSTEHIRHPANCQLMRHNENVSKGKKKSISIEELRDKIKTWDEKYLGK